MYRFLDLIIENIKNIFPARKPYLLQSANLKCKQSQKLKAEFFIPVYYQCFCFYP